MQKQRTRMNSKEVTIVFLLHCETTLLVLGYRLPLSTLGGCQFCNIDGCPEHCALVLPLVEGKREICIDRIMRFASFRIQTARATVHQHDRAQPSPCKALYHRAAAGDNAEDTVARHECHVEKTVARERQAGEDVEGEEIEAVVQVGAGEARKGFGNEKNRFTGR